MSAAAVGVQRERRDVPPAPSSSSPPPSPHWHAEVNRVADDFFYRLGRRVALNPKRVVALAVFGVLVCCAGFVNFTVESASERLWVPRESISRTQEETVQAFFDEDTEWGLVLFEHPDEGGNVLTKASVDALWELDAKITELETGAGEAYSELCVKDLDGVTCTQPFSGVTSFWGDDFETYTATVADNADVLEAINVDEFPGGGRVAPAAIFGNSIVHDGEGRITGARVMMQAYALSKTIGDTAREEVALEWLEVLQDFLGEETETSVDLEEEEAGGGGVDIVYFTSRSLDDALAESVAGEIFLFVATYVVMVVCVMLCVGRCSRGAVERRSWLGLGGVGIVVASGVAAYGLCSGFGVPFTSLSQLLPFILIGIGVDDMFVIVASLDHTDVGLSVEERLALALKRCGVSISYTSLTNFSAFLLGSVTSLPAVEYFCVYAATSLLFVFILQITVFTAFLAMDLNRQNAGKLDWCCCCTSRTYLEERAKRGVSLPPLPSSSSSGPLGTAVHEGSSEESKVNSVAVARGHRRQTTAAEEEEEETAEFYVNPMALLNKRAASLAARRTGSKGSEGGGGGGCGGGGGGESRGEVRRLTGAGKWMRDKYAPFLLSAKGKVLVFMATASLLVAGIYGVTKAKQGFDALDLAPDDHFARDFMETARSYDLEPDTYFVGMRVFTPAVDYTNSTVQALIQVSDTLMTDDQYFTGPVDSWLASFGEWAASNPDYSANAGRLWGYRVYQDPRTFYPALSDFLADGGNERFQSDIAFADDGEIEMSFSNMFIVGLTGTEAEVGALKAARSVMARSPLEPEPFASSGIFLYIEQFLVIYEELIINFLLALLAVAVLSLIVLGTVRVVLLVCFTVVMIDVELLGFVYHWGLEVNAINVIELIMAVGLVVDYMVHVVHYYLHQDPAIAKDLRIGRALGEIGPSVAVGAITTFLGIMPMAFANNVVFRVFFKMFFVIITFGFYHGVVFIPVALSLLPESSCSPSCCSSSSSPPANPVSGARKKNLQVPDDGNGRDDDAKADGDGDGDADAGPSCEWTVYTGRPEPTTHTKAAVLGTPCPATNSGTESDRRNGGGDGGARRSWEDGAAHRAEIDGHRDAAGVTSVAAGADAGGGGGGGGGSGGMEQIQVERGDGLDEGGAASVAADAVAGSAGGGGMEKIQVERGDGLDEGGAAAPASVTKSGLGAAMVDVEAGSGGTPGGRRRNPKAGVGGSVRVGGGAAGDLEKPGTSTRKCNPQAETPTSVWTAAEVGSGLGMATGETEVPPGAQCNVEQDTGRGLGAPIK